MIRQSETAANSLPGWPVNAPVACRLRCWSNDHHLRQLYTGLSILHRRGHIRLAQEFVPAPPPDSDKPQYLRFASMGYASLEIRGQMVGFDMIDSSDLDEEMLRSCDWYFKRSLALSAPKLPHGSARLRPWGLNYQVECDHFDWFALERDWRLGSGLMKFREIRRHLPGSGAASMALRRLEHPPAESEPKILFLTRVWDHDDDPGRSDEKRRHFMELNAMRAECVRRLRKAFGSRFSGGLADTPLARSLFPDAIFREPALTRKKAYLNLVKSHSIGVTTGGLHGSLGGKLGEYVAMSRAVVTERLECRVAGNFREGTHFLSFATPEQCVDQVKLLMEDRATRTAMMAANHRYYRDYLDPTRVIANALAQVLAS